MLLAEPIGTPTTTGSSFTYSCGTGSAVTFTSTSVSGTGSTYTITAVYGTGSSHQTGDAFTVSIAAAAIVDLAGNAMTSSANSGGSTVTFGECSVGSYLNLLLLR